MEALYRLGKASSLEIRDAIPNPPTHTAVRTHLAILEEKGQIRHHREGLRHIFEPVVPADQMGQEAITGVLQNFFGGSIERAVAALLKPGEANLDDDQFKRLSELIERARSEGR